MSLLFTNDMKLYILLEWIKTGALMKLHKVSHVSHTELISHR